ncbi:MAG: lysylphosphatidylglycerol synthase transmembrane domain-containing protein [Candidatus Nanoarchaeia archaeon]|nr:lysylphosphatidylglycerol synthase transmembrane domain-containing protein [Candidatus Nanoarchaeia archaeon]
MGLKILDTISIIIFIISLFGIFVDYSHIYLILTLVSGVYLLFRLKSVMSFIKKSVFIFIGIFLFAYLIYHIGIDSIIQGVLKANIGLCLSYTGLVVLTSIPKAVRMNFLLKTQGKAYSIKKAIEVWMFGFFLASTTPGRLGDFMKVISFKKELNIPKSKGMVLQFTDRLFDFISMILISFFSSIWIGINFLPEMYIFSIFSGVILLLSFFVLYSEKFARRSISFMLKLLPKKYKPRVGEITHNAFEAVSLLKKNIKKLSWLFIFSIFLWLISFFSSWVLFMAIGISISPLHVIAFSSLAVLVSLIPISIQGLGTGDAVNILLFSLVGVAASDIITVRMLGLFYNTFLFGAIAFIFYLKHIKNLGGKAND